MPKKRRNIVIISALMLVFITGIKEMHSKQNKITEEPPPPEIHQLRLVPYNEVPGTQELNIFALNIKREIVSPGVISPDKTKMAYSEVYYYPHNRQTSSKIFYVPVKAADLPDSIPSDQADKIFALKTPANPGKSILESGFKSYDSGIFRTMTVVDWSSDSKKILVKETIGEHLRGIWATVPWVYNFETRESKRLDEIRKAITYYWKTKHHLYIEDYRWDIIPLGWDLKKTDRIVVNTYGYNYDNKYFLGCWSIDIEGKRSQLLSLEDQNWPVGKYGLILKKE